VRKTQALNAHTPSVSLPARLELINIHVSPMNSSYIRYCANIAG